MDLHFGLLTGCATTRWSSTLSSKVNLHHAIIFRALYGADLVTLPLEKMHEQKLRAPPSGVINSPATLDAGTDPTFENKATVGLAWQVPTWVDSGCAEPSADFKSSAVSQPSAGSHPHFSFFSPTSHVEFEQFLVWQNFSMAARKSNIVHGRIGPTLMGGGRQDRQVAHLSPRWRRVDQQAPLPSQERTPLNV